MGAQRVGAGEEVAELRRKRQLGREDDVFRGAPAYFAFFEKIHVASFAILKARRNTGEQRVAVLKLGAGAELTVDDYLGGRTLRGQVLHVEIGRDGAGLQSAPRIHFDDFWQRLGPPAFGNRAEFGVLEGVGESGLR